MPGSVGFRRMSREAEAALRRMRCRPPTRRRRSRILSIAERQLVEVVKGVALAPRVLILDEPTSSLTIREVRSSLRSFAGLHCAARRSSISRTSSTKSSPSPIG